MLFYVRQSNDGYNNAEKIFQLETGWRDNNIRKRWRKAQL